MKKIFSYLFILFLLTTFAVAQTTLEVNADGNKLKEFYLNEHVEKLWIKGQHVNWETGEADDPNATKGIKTHCSAFAASVCKQMDIYILQPPDHSHGSLANAQYNWLFTTAANKKGWKQITDNVFKTAQQLANEGKVVVAVYKNSDEKKPGHIALIMPAIKTETDLANEGPALIQAGRINSSHISLKQGFEKHITSWLPPTNEIVFFYNIN